MAFAHLKYRLSRLFRRRRKLPRPRRRTNLRGGERLEGRALLAGLPYGALPLDTAEYLLGDVQVNVVFMESNGGLDANKENWTPQLISATKSKIEEGILWWKETLAAYYPLQADALNFRFDFTHADQPVSTPYEPISRKSNDFNLWMYDFLRLVGHAQTSDFSHDIKAYNHAQRLANETDWSFTIFVVNDTADPDKQFDPSGDFDRSFAYSGGRFFVALASRPASTFSHEMGHIFWARDEYFGGSSWTDERGYYNTQNVNAANNPTPGFRQEDSIMISGTALARAYANHVSASSTLEMVGWKDSDGDGILDVVDVPFALDGQGYFDAAAGRYRFQGTSQVATLPNRNSDPNTLKNDITINRIREAQYRIDGGAWQTAMAADAPSVSLDLSIPLDTGSQQIEIRTIDTRTGATSGIFRGSTGRPATTSQPGIEGFLWNDVDSDGDYDSGEFPLAGWTVQLVDDAGEPRQFQRRLDPDAYAAGTSVTQVMPGVTLSAAGPFISTSAVISRTDPNASTGSRVFSNGNTASGWSTTRQLRIEFDSPVTQVSLDAIGNGPGADYGRLEVYDASDKLLARYTTASLSSGQIETMIVSRGEGDIKYALAYGHVNSALNLDNLRLGPELPSAQTDALGFYTFAYVPAGNYRVQVESPVGWSFSTTAPGTQVVTVTAGGTTTVESGAQIQSRPWQNPRNRFDVNDDGKVVPFDVLTLINAINSLGPQELPPPGSHLGSPAPYYDVNGDGAFSAIDVLHAIGEVNRLAEAELASGRSFSSNPTASGTTASGSSNSGTPLAGRFAGGSGEGESVLDPSEGTAQAVPLPARAAFFAAWPAKSSLPLSSSPFRRLTAVQDSPLDGEDEGGIEGT